MPDLADSDYDLVPTDQQPQFADQLAPPSALASQVQGFPQRAADLGMAALGPIGEAGMTVGDMMRTGQVDPRDIPQVVGGVMMGAAAPEAEEAAPLEAGAEAVAKGITAYHGSPYDFDKFDLSKIGTGEGAQAYGHGLYFAESPGTAGTYRNTQQLLNTPENIAAGYLQRYEDPSVAAKAIQDDLSSATDDANFQKHGPEALRLLQSGAEPKPGKMYQVSINADPEHFLDWDKPLSEQHPVVQEALSTLDHGQGPQSTGYDVLNGLIRGKYNNPQNAEKSAAATQTLRQAGIPGIKYLDQGSRGSGNGTSNYVVFDDNLINIVQKYGLAGLIAGGASHFSTVPTNKTPDFGDQHFAKGGSVKSTKAQAHYHGGTKAKRCADCNMFEPPHGCSAVIGSISPHGVCDFFERKSASKAA